MGPGAQDWLYVSENPTPVPLGKVAGERDVGSKEQHDRLLRACVDRVVSQPTVGTSSGRSLTAFIAWVLSEGDKRDS